MTAKPAIQAGEDELPPIVGRSPAVRSAVNRLRQFARSRISVLLVGPTGTGKELLARHLHALSGRRGELVDINCGALPREMIESMLFGHRRGAFTGAVEDAAGLVAKAAGGTLFLDELPSLPLEGQAKLLRLLETGEVRPIGETAKRLVDFRVVSTAQEDIASRVEAGGFRRDLFHRVAGLAIRLPPLRERPEDVEPLAAHFAARHARVLGSGTARLLENQPWPGNVRELRAVIDRAAVLSDEEALGVPLILDALSCWGGTGALADPGPSRSRARLDGGQRHVSDAALREACAANDWDTRRIAPALGVSRATLYRRLRECGISLRHPRVSGPTREL